MDDFLSEVRIALPNAVTRLDKMGPVLAIVPRSPGTSSIKHKAVSLLIYPNLGICISIWSHYWARKPSELCELPVLFVCRKLEVQRNW